MIVLLSGCGTSSKVDNFLTSYSDADVIQKPIENFSWISDDLLSEQLLLGWWDADFADDGYGVYIEYSDTALQNALNEQKRVVLIAFDENCDNCVSLDQSVSTALARIPSDVVVMKILFTQAQSLYSITEQNSVIYLNTDGSVRYLSDGGMSTIENIVYYL